MYDLSSDLLSLLDGGGTFGGYLFLNIVLLGGLLSIGLSCDSTCKNITRVRSDIQNPALGLAGWLSVSSSCA